VVVAPTAAAVVVVRWGLHGRLPHARHRESVHFSRHTCGASTPCGCHPCTAFMRRRAAALQHACVVTPRAVAVAVPVVQHQRVWIALPEVAGVWQRRVVLAVVTVAAACGVCDLQW